MSTQTEYIIEAPNSPEEFGVPLPPPTLRRLDFSALDYQNMQRAAVEYIRTYHPDKFNDFFASNGVIMLVEVFAYLSNVLSQRGDILVDESFLPTARSKTSVIQHLALIGQQINRATPATVDVEASIDSAVATELRVPAGTRFSFPGPDGLPVFYEIYRAPDDFSSSISIPPGKRGVIAFGLEGLTSEPFVVTAVGGPDQFVEIIGNNILSDPVFVTINTGDETRTWARVPIIEKASPSDEVFEVVVLDGKIRIKFGNDIAGKSPLAGEIITVLYRTGGGTRGRIAAGTINESRPISPLPPASASVEVLFRNPSPSQGGTDEESINDARRRAPRQFATHNAAITGEDYGLLASEFVHPVFGSVAKAVGTIRTGIDGDITTIAEEIRAAPTVDEAVSIMTNKFVNRNIVEIYVLAEGSDGDPVKPSIGLKDGLRTFFEQINVLTDEVRVLDGEIKNVDVQATIVMTRNADAGTVKNSVQLAIDKFFDIRNFDMGTPLYVSNLYDVIQSVAGVKYVKIYEPADDINFVEKGSSSENGVKFNEVISLGDINLQFFFEKGSFGTATQ